MSEIFNYYLLTMESLNYLVLDERVKDLIISNVVENNLSNNLIDTTQKGKIKIDDKNEKFNDFLDELVEIVLKIASNHYSPPSSLQS